jgi:orotate phosphoribosyltransferase
MTLDSLTLTGVVFLLSISTIITLADSLGFLPYQLSKWLNRNRIALTIAVLKEFGIDVESYKRRNVANNFLSYFNSDDLENSIKHELSDITIRKEINIVIGKASSVQTDQYIDLMGVSVNSEKSELFARYLSTYWNQLLVRHEISSDEFDFVITPKNGSPILGYEFSKLVNRPFGLHTSQDKFKGTSCIHQRFDFIHPPENGTKALIVDDSTTGGRMVIEAIDDLRKFGYVVTDCLVVFEPQLKNARELIASNKFAYTLLLKHISHQYK